MNKSKNAAANPSASGYLKQERQNGKPTVNRYAVGAAKKDIIMSLYHDNPLEMAAETIGTMCGGITDSELDEAISTAARELAEAAGLHDFLEPAMFGPDYRDMINSVKRVLGWGDDPVTKGRKTLRSLHKTASESEREEALRIAVKEIEFEEKVDQYYKGLDEKRRDELFMRER